MSIIHFEKTYVLTRKNLFILLADSNPHLYTEYIAFRGQKVRRGKFLSATKHSDL